MSISVDSSTPAIVVATSNTTGIITTASFAPPANSLVVVMVNATFNTGSTQSSWTVTDSVSNTYTAGPFQHVASHDANTGIFTFYYTSAPGAITVTATDTSTAAAGRFLCVQVLTGAASDQTGAANATNSGAPGNGSTVDCTIPITPTADGSVIYGIVADGTSGASTITADTGTTNISDPNNPHNNSTDLSSSAAGTSDGAIGWTITGTFWWAGAALEILPNDKPFIAGSKAAAATLTFTTPITVATSPGDTLCVVLSNTGSTTVSALTDSQSNVYTLDTFSTSSPVAYFYRCPGATGGSGGGQSAALSTSDTVTATLSAASGTQNMTVICAPGVGALDAQSGTTNGTGTSVSPSATPTRDDDWAIGAVNVANAGGMPSASSPYTLLGSLNTSGGTFSASDYDLLGTGTAGNAQSTTFTWSTSASFRAKLWLFIAPNPPPPPRPNQLLQSAIPGVPEPGLFVPGEIFVHVTSVTYNVTAAASVAITGVTASSIGKMLSAGVAAVSSVTRRIFRGILAVLAVIPSVKRLIPRLLSGVAAVSPSIAVTKVKTVVLAAVTALQGVTVKQAGRILAGPVTATGTVNRRVTRILSGNIAFKGTLNSRISKSLPVIVTAAGSVQRKVLPVLKTSFIVVSGTTRTVGRSIQGTIAAAGQTTRNIGRVVSSKVAFIPVISKSRLSFITLNVAAAVSGNVIRRVKVTESAVVAVVPQVSRGFSRTFTATVAAVVNFTAATGPQIAGVLLILIPGSCAKIIKGLFTQTLPALKMKLLGTVGTTSTFNIKLPSVKVNLTGGVDLLAVKLPVPVISLAGNVIHQPLNIKLPSPVVSLTGKPGRAGMFNIDFGNCADMWRYLMAPIVLPDPESNEIEWTFGSSHVAWKTGVPVVRWSAGPFAGYSQDQLSTDYIRVGVTALVNGEKYNPTGDVVKFAFMPDAVQVPQVTDWVSGSWETTGSIVYPYKARCLVGPNGVSLGSGVYVVYVQVVDNPETFVSAVGSITIF